MYKITCKNPINETIGKVVFTEGVGYTADPWHAYWFDTKDGFLVEEDNEVDEKHLADKKDEPDAEEAKKNNSKPKGTSRK